MTALIGADLALVRNSSAFVAAYPGDVIHIGEILELKPERKKPLKLSAVVEAGCDFAERHGARTMHSDHHVLEPAREHLREGFSIRAVDGSQKARQQRYIITRVTVPANPDALAKHKALGLVASDPSAEIVRKALGQPAGASPPVIAGARADASDDLVRSALRGDVDEEIDRELRRAGL